MRTPTTTRLPGFKIREGEPFALNQQTLVWDGTYADIDGQLHIRCHTKHQTLFVSATGVTR